MDRRHVYGGGRRHRGGILGLTAERLHELADRTPQERARDTYDLVAWAGLLGLPAHEVARASGFELTVWSVVIGRARKLDAELWRQRAQILIGEYAEAVERGRRKGG
jgi:hypothetical protein